MSVINRRNAIFGWLAWTAAKELGKRRARRQLHVDGGGGGRRVAVPALVAATAAGVGFLIFWRRRRPAGADEYAQ